MEDIDPEQLEARAEGLFLRGADFYSRTIYLIGDFNQEMLVRFTANFLTMDRAEGRIDIHLNSSGGDEPVGYAIYDMIRESRNPVRVFGYGVVQSIAAVVLQAGTERFLSPECRFMIHNGTADVTSASISPAELASMSKDANETLNRYYHMLALRSNLSWKQVRKMCRKETYLSTGRAIDYGFADGCTDSLTEG